MPPAPTDRFEGPLFRDDAEAAIVWGDPHKHQRTAEDVPFHARLPDPTQAVSWGMRTQRKYEVMVVAGLRRALLAGLPAPWPAGEATVPLPAGDTDLHLARDTFDGPLLVAATGRFAAVWRDVVGRLPVGADALLVGVSRIDAAATVQLRAAAANAV